MRTFINSFYVILGGCSFGILAPLVKLGYTYGISTSDSVRLQFMVGFMLLGLINILFVKYRMSLKTFVKVLLSGTPMAFTTSFYYNSLEYLDASIAIVLLFQYTWMGLIVDMFLDKQAPTKEKLGAIVLLFVGSILAVNIYDINLNHLPPRGIMWGLLAAMSFTLFLFASGNVANHVPPLRKSFVMSLGALTVILIVFPPTDFITGHLHTSFWLLGLTLGLFGVVLPPLLFSISIPKVGNGLGTILSSSELPTTTIMSAFILSEKVTLLQWLGIVIILLGIVWAHIPQLRRQSHAKV
ncbi:MAG TPA: DMT family transporter [Bacillota bacterium]|nr:DMT family transporter [Bacillota bacterium]